MSRTYVSGELLEQMPMRGAFALSSYERPDLRQVGECAPNESMRREAQVLT